jgi:type VI secretion system protein ImpE
MTDAREALRAGDVQGALASLKAEVRKAPRDARLRTFLFQLFCVSGEWDRALTQLTAAGELDGLALPMVQAYKTCIRLEMLRESVFRGERSPTVLGDPGEWVPLLIEATKLLGAGKPAEAASLRDRAFELAPESGGLLNETAVEWVADADPRLGPVLEVFLNGNYMWVPFARLSRLEFDPPSDLRDQVWMPARFRWTNKGEAVGFIPTRYPGSATAEAALQLARRTDWIELSEDWSLPVGQRMLVSDADETALMDIRTLAMAVEEEAGAEGDAPADASAGDSDRPASAGDSDRPASAGGS